jgi:Bax protein
MADHGHGTTFNKVALVGVSAAVVAMYVIAGIGMLSHDAPPPVRDTAKPLVKQVHKQNLPAITHIKASPETDALLARFQQSDYTLDAVRAGAPVPGIFLAALPQDLADVAHVQDRKNAFFGIMLPLILRANAEIRNDRAHIEKQVAHSLAVADAPAWLLDLAKTYKVKVPAEGQFPFAALLKRVAPVPPSLALAQAAEESGWGTSRFAKHGNALFGQWTYDPAHTGIVPASRADGQRHRIRTFPTLLDTVRAYMLNLNSHAAYQKLRDMRAALHKQNKPITGAALASTLDAYSARGAAYPKSLQAIIRVNDLAPLDQATLQPGYDKTL